MAPTAATRASALLARVLPERALAAAIRAAYPRAEPELAALDSYVPRGGTAVDVGAWYGPWTARLLRRADRVVAIEPTPSLAAHLRRAFPTVDVVEAVASDRAGTTTLHVPAAGPVLGTSSVGADSVSADSVGADSVSADSVGADSVGADSVGADLVGADSVAAGDTVAVTVRALPLDALGLTGVTFIKFDVEGHELPALQGAQRTIRRDRPALLVELEARIQPVAPVLDLLAGWGYEPSVLIDGSWRPLAGFDLESHQRNAIGRVSQSFVRKVVWPRPRYVNLVLLRPC